MRRYFYDALQDIASEAGRLQSVIENLLLLTRMEASGGLDLEPVLLQRVTAEQVELFLRHKPSRTVELVEEDRLDPIDGQPALLALVIDNLLSNADKYSPSETTIIVALRKNDQGEAELTVRDNGIGVDENEMQNLFTPFYRTGSAKSYARGMGLGLAVCKRIMDAHGGRIWASRRPEGGSDFTLTLAMREDASELND